MSKDFSERHWSIKMGWRFSSDRSEAEAGVRHLLKTCAHQHQPIGTGRGIGHKMLTLWALAIMLAIQAGALDLSTSPSQVGAPPDKITSRLPVHFPISVPDPQVPRISSIRKGSLPPRRAAGTSGARCSPVAKYLVSSSKLNDYLNATLTPKIENMLKCEEINLAGVLGEVISTVSNSGLLSVLDLTSSLDILGGGGLGGILGRGSSNKSPKHPQSLLSEATGAVSDLGQGALGSLPLLGGENAVKELVDSTGLLTGDKLKETTEGILNSVVPKDINSALTGLLGNIDLEDLLLGLEVEKVTVENMTSTMTGNGILVHAVTTAFIGGNGLAGPVVSILGFQVHADVTLEIGISSNNTQCVSLLVQEKNIEVKNVNLQIAEVVTGVLPLPLPLDDTISQLLTVTMNENIEGSKSCGIELSDINECKNSTGLFNYQVKSPRTSAEGLSILYCAYFNQNKSPVPGSHLPPDPKNVNTAVILSQMMLREIVTKSAKESSVKINNLEAAITKIVYHHLPNNKINAAYGVTIVKDGENIATGQTEVTISHASEISNNKIKTTIKTDSAKHSVIPPEAEEEERDVLREVLKKLLFAVTRNVNQWNIPLGVIPNSINSAKLQVLKSNDFQATN
uniref:Vomeromodulin-like n=2 Tax=Bos TaxID=9903 RepID=E1BI89_BOVIN